MRWQVQLARRESILRALFQNLFSYLRAFPMRAEAFEFREFFHRLQRLLQRRAIVFHHARAVLELIHRQAATGVAVAI